MITNIPRWLRRIVFGEHHRFRLRPDDGNSFDLDPLHSPYPARWVFVSAHLLPSAAGYPTQLLFDTGDGCHQAGVDLHVTRAGAVRELIKLPSAIRRMTWMSASPTSRFEPKVISMKEVRAPERTWRMLRRVVPMFFRHTAVKRRRAGLTLSDVFFRLSRAYEAAGRLRLQPATREYRRWIARHDRLNDRDRVLIARHIERMRAKPLISVLMPVYNAPERWLREAIESVRAQLYPHWELCIADDASSPPHVRTVLDEYAARDARIKVKYLSTNGHISRASNAALSLVEGEYVALLDHDDVLAPHALYWIAAELEQHPDAQIVYSDEDKIDEDGERFAPYFKPDWNPQLACSQNFVSHLGVYRTEAVRAVGGFREGYEGSQDYDLMLRIAERAASEQIRHVPAVLYHWRAAPGSTALANAEKSYAWDAGRRAIAEHLQRQGARAKVLADPAHHFYRVRYALPEPAPKVSIIIPTRDRYDLLSRCIESLLARTTYRNYEVRIVDNGSKDAATIAYLHTLRGRSGFTVLRYDAPFNYSAMNNLAAEEADGDVLCLLNNDTEVIAPDWIQEMLGILLQKGVGIVGARLLYPNETVQHAGILMGVGGTANHAHAFLHRDQLGYYGRARLAQDYCAVTGACLMIRKSLYRDLCGLDAEHLPVAYNDVDLCLRAGKAGWRVVYTPYAELYHYESASRGKDRSPERKAQARRERDYLRHHWAKEIAEDPFYNPNLSKRGPFFLLSDAPRVKKPWLQ
ncbi:MAG: glycosyltransferase [Sulfurifustis sp.]